MRFMRPPCTGHSAHAGACLAPATPAGRHKHCRLQDQPVCTFQGLMCMQLLDQALQCMPCSLKASDWLHGMSSVMRASLQPQLDVAYAHAHSTSQAYLVSRHHTAKGGHRGVLKPHSTPCARMHGRHRTAAAGSPQCHLALCTPVDTA